MTYDAIRERLRRSKEELEKREDERDAQTRQLIEALEQLNATLESDLAQIKAALSHVARLLEPSGNN